MNDNQVLQVVGITTLALSALILGYFFGWFAVFLELFGVIGTLIICIAAETAEEPFYDE